MAYGVRFGLLLTNSASSEAIYVERKKDMEIAAKQAAAAAASATTTA